MAQSIAPLVFGGTVCIPPQDATLPELISFARAKHVNWVLCRSSFVQRIQPQDAPTLETLVLASNNVDADVHETVTHGGILDLNVSFSATNTTGRDPHTHLWLTDPNNVDRLTPIGATGEILVHGAQIAGGYLNNERLSRQTFIGAPSWAKQVVTTSKLCQTVRTGYLGMYNAEGSIVYVGHKKGHCEVDGRRTDLNGVERLVVKSSNVKQAVLLVPASASLTSRLMAVLVLAQDPTDERELKPLHVINIVNAGALPDGIRLIERLVALHAPANAFPTFWVIVESFSLSAESKVDRGAVRRFVEALDPSYTLGEKEIQSTRSFSVGNSVERKIAGIWAEILKIDEARVSFTTSSFSHGGDSISCIRLVSALRRAGFSTPALDILSGSTIVEMAAPFVREKASA